MSSHPATVPFLIALVLVAVVLAGFIQLDDGAARAVAKEMSGQTRGPFLDRFRRPLVFTRISASRAVRAYAFPDLATILGYGDAPDQWTGLERRYDSLLTGRSMRRDWRTFFLHLRGQPVMGGSVQLTLDRVIQAAAERALGPHMGAIVAIEPRTGAVLAMVTRPACSPRLLGAKSGARACGAERGQALLDRGTGLRVPPGSSFKIVTLTAALDTHHFSLDSLFSGADAFGPSPYFDNSEYPSNVTRSDLTVLTLAQALAFSDNFAFAHIGLTLGSRTLLQYAHRFRVGRSIPFDLPVKESVVAGGSSHPSLSVLAQSAFGGTPDLVTPLQMALIAAAVANHGLLMRPYLVSALRSPSGQVLRRFHPHPLDRAMTPSTARDVTKGMVFVVDHGSGFEAQIPGIAVAGKTGTAASGANRPNAWFIAFAPAYHPIIAVAVLREYSGEGFAYAAPLARQVLLAALREERTVGLHPSSASRS